MNEILTGSPACFSVAGYKLTVETADIQQNRHPVPELLSLFISPINAHGSARLFFKWENDESFCFQKIRDPAYRPVRRKWLDCFIDGSPQIFSHVVNDSWMVFFSSERGNALGVGPENCFFDIFSSALDLAYTKISLENDFLSVHAAAVVTSGQCLLFFADSGGGKTTLSKAAIDRRYKVLSDDRIFILQKDGEYAVHGTPFGRIGVNEGGYPIKGIFFLEQSNQNLVEPVSTIDFFKQVWFIDYNRKRRFFGGVEASKHFKRLMDFLERYPTYRLKFRKDFQDWEYIEQATGL